MHERLCILTSVHSAFDARIFHKQAKSLARVGYEVTLIAQHRGDEEVDGVKILALPKSRNRFFRMIGVHRIFRIAYSQKADIYHFHDPELLPVGLLLKLLTKAKLIYDVHEDYPASILHKRWVPFLLRRPLSWAFDMIEKFIASRLDCVITVVDDLSRQFRCKRVVTIWNYPILQKDHPPSDRYPDRPRLVYLGGLTQKRGITEIVRAMEYLGSKKNVKLTLCGKFDPPEYEEQIRGMKGFERVECLGWVEPEEVPSILGSATIGMACLHPSPNYTYMPTTKVFEYMAAALPVVASNAPKWRDFIEATNSGLTVNPLDAGEIAKAVDYLVEHPTEAKVMGENGRTAVMQKYNWNNESQKLLALYEELLREMRRRIE